MWGLLAAVLVLAVLSGIGTRADALTPGPGDPYTISITLSQSVAKTNDTVGVTFQSYWTNTTYWNYTTYHEVTNKTTNVTYLVPDYHHVVNATYIPSPGPVLVQVKDSQGKDVVGASGIHNLTNGVFSVSFLITPAFGLDTITFYARDMFTNVSAIPTSLQVDYSEAQRKAETQAQIAWYENGLQANHDAQEGQRWFWWYLQSAVQWVLVVGALLAVTYRVQKRAKVNTWWDVLHHHRGFTSVVNPMRYAAHSVRTKTLNVPAEITAKETLYKKRQAIEVLSEMRNLLDELEEDDVELKHMEVIERQARTSLGLKPVPEVRTFVDLAASDGGSQ